MQTNLERTIVVIPNDKKLEVSFYCSDQNLKNGEKKNFSDVIIQMDDCHTSVKIPRANASRRQLLDLSSYTTLR